MHPAGLRELPRFSRLRVVPCGDEGIYVHIPFPRAGGVVILLAGICFVILAGILKALVRNPGNNLGRLGHPMVWPIAVSIVAIAGLSLLVMLWLRPHLLRTLFERTTLTLVPGHIVVRTIWRIWKLERDVTFDPGENVEVREIAVPDAGVLPAIEVRGTAGTVRFGELLSPPEREWLVETALAVLARPRVQIEGGGGAARASQEFDAFQIADGSPVNIIEDRPEILRCRFAPNRGFARLLAGLVLLACTVFLFVLFGSGGDLQREWNNVIESASVGSAVLLFVISLIASLPGLAGFWILAGRKSITLTRERLSVRWHAGPFGLSREVPTPRIDAVTTLAFADGSAARQIQQRRTAPDGAMLEGCIVCCGEKHLVLSLDKRVAPVLMSLLRGKLAELGSPANDVRPAMQPGAPSAPRRKND